jgi:hypothetical protein
MNHLCKPILGIALCAGSAAMAQQFEPGVHAAVNFPFGDLGSAVDHSLGITVGGHLGIYYGGGHELRPRLDFSNYQGGWTPEGGGFSRNTINAWQIGCDYLYYTETRPQGFYLAMGLGYQWWNVSPENAGSYSHSALSMAAGPGYRFNHSFSVEARFTTGQFRSTNGQADALQLMGSLRF